VDFITEDGYEIKLGMEEEYQQWVIDHAAEIRRAQPEGVEYLGTYVLVWGSDTTSGSWRDMYRLDSYAALDRIAAASKDPDSKLRKLQEEGGRFLDMHRTPERWSHNLMKSIVDATVIKTPAEETREMVGASR
jgi:hypothetical protein